MKIARTALVAFICATALAIAPVAMASPSTSAYGGACSTPSLCDSSSLSSNSTTTNKASANGASLPFTGINVLEVAAMGLVLVGAGFVVRRNRHPSDS